MRKFTVVIALLLVVALATPALGASFPDVPSNHWAYEAINKLVAAGIIEGYPDGTYKGQNNLTRYEIAMIVSRALDNISAEREEMLERIDSMGEDKAGLTTEEAQDVTAIVKALIQKNMPEQPEMPENLTETQVNEVANLVEALTFEYRAELKVLGSDIEDLQMDMDAVEARVAALESGTPVVSFNGSYDVDFERVTTDGTGIVPEDEADAETEFGPYTATDYYFMDPYSTSSGSYVEQLDSDTMNEFNDSEDFRMTDGEDYYVEDDVLFENTLDLNVAVNKGPLSADLDLVASSNVFGGAESGSFDLEDLSGTVTTPDFTATVSNDQTVTFKDYLFDEATVNGVVATSDNVTAFTSRNTEVVDTTYSGIVYGEEDIIDTETENTYTRAGAMMGFDLMLPVNAYVGYEYNETTDENLGILAMDTMAEFAGMDVTADFATSIFDSVENDYLFKLGATGELDMFELTFNYVKNENFANTIVGSTPDSGYDVEVAGSLGMVDASVLYEDYGVAETTLKAAVEEGKLSVAGVDVDGSYRLTTNENDGKKEVREINASTLVSGASLSYYYDYNADNEIYDEELDRVDNGQNLADDWAEEDEDENEHKFIADYMVNDKISVYGEAVFSKSIVDDDTDIVWDSEFTNTNEVGADYVSGPITAGIVHVFDGDTTITGRYTADMYEAGFEKVLDGDLVIDGKVMSPVYTVWGVDVSGEAMMKRNIDTEAQDLGVLVDASKVVNERLALNAGLEYGDKEIDVDYAGVKLAANAGLEYMITEDVTANADYEYLDWEGDTNGDYTAQKATMGVSVAF